MTYGLHTAFNAVPPGARQTPPTWFQDLLAEFVAPREAAACAQRRGELHVHPVVVASNQAAQATVLGTPSWEDRMSDLTIHPLSIADLVEIATDALNRILRGTARSPFDHCPQSVYEVLRWIGGAPRGLAWLLSALSGRRGHGISAERLTIGGPPKRNPNLF